MEIVPQSLESYVSEPSAPEPADPAPPRKAPVAGGGRKTAASANGRSAVRGRRGPGGTGAGNPDNPAADRAISARADAGGEDRLGAEFHLPLVSASLRLPRPGAVARVGPVRVKLPPGALYYGGLAMLAVGGAVELPVAAGLAAVGVVLSRGRVGRIRPSVSVCDTEPGAGPAGRE
jgi:hypothetical protein